jgi:hypothetical protein
MWRFAGNLVVLTLGPAVGCQRLSGARLLDVAPPPAPPAALVPASPPVDPAAAGAVPATLAATRPAPIAAAPATAPRPAAAPAPATPLLDAALTRARAEAARTQLVAFEPEAVPAPLPAALLGEALPPIPLLLQPPQSDSKGAPLPKSDPKVETAAALVPGKPGEPAIAPRPIDPGRPDESAQSVDPWHEGLERLASVARDRAAGARGATRDLWSLRARVLGWLAENENATTSEAETLQRSVLDWLTGPEPETPARIRTAVAALEDQMPFEITELQLCRKVKGFGDYEPIEAAACRPGHGMIVYCEMTGVRYAPDAGCFRSRLASRAEIRGAGGGELVWTGVLGTADDVCHRRRRDFYVNYRVTIPESLAPGSYELRLIQDDLIGSQSATRTVGLVIAP